MRGGRSALVLGVLLCRAARATPGKAERHAARRERVAGEAKARGRSGVGRTAASTSSAAGRRTAARPPSRPHVQPSKLRRCAALPPSPAPDAGVSCGARAASALALRLRCHLSSAWWVLTAHLQPGKGGCRCAYRLRHRRRGRWEGRRIRIDKQLSALSRRRSGCATARARCDACVRSATRLCERRVRRSWRISSNDCPLPRALFVAVELSLWCSLSHGGF
jgi:hypothetical protein